MSPCIPSTSRDSMPSCQPCTQPPSMPSRKVAAVQEAMDARIPAGSTDRRNRSFSVLASASVEPGYWACKIDDGSWLEYPWPACSIIEQAFCRWKSDAELAVHGVKFRIAFQEPLDEICHKATQVELTTGLQREVRRWPSSYHRCLNEEKLLAEQAMLEARERQQREEAERQRREDAERVLAVQAAWATWMQASWVWALLNESDGALCDSAKLQPYAASPAKVSLNLEASVSFQQQFWPELMRGWPMKDLICGAHPRGTRCNFALERLTPEESITSTATHEWKLLTELWGKGGIKAPLVAAFRVQNQGLLHAFSSMKNTMAASLKADNFTDGQSREHLLNCQMLWHGTRSVDNLINICSDGFDRMHAKTCAFGKGCYFAAAATYSNNYACNVRIRGSQRKFRAIILASVLLGESAQGASNLYPAPVKSHSKNGDRYEHCVNKELTPSIFVTFKDHQAVPAYVVVYELPS